MAPPIATPDELSPAETRVWHASRVGEHVDFLANKQPGGEEASTQIEASRTIRAGLLAQLLTGEGLAAGVAVRALWLRGARIQGHLNLESASLRCPLTLTDCQFDHAITLNQAVAPSISLSGSTVPAIEARQLVTHGNLELDEGFTALGGVSLEGAHIGGKLVCTGGQFQSKDGLALNADSVTIGLDLLCDGAFMASSEVRLFGAHIGGQFQCSGGQFSSSDGQALNADEVTVSQSVFLDDKFTAEGGVSLVGAHLGSDLSCTNARLNNPGDTAFDGNRLEVKGNMFCDYGFFAKGEVGLVGAHVSGQLMCSAGHFSNPGGIALNADGLTVDQDLYCDEGFRATGETRLLGGHIAGQLQCTDGHFSNPHGPSLNADGLTVDQDVYCDDGFSSAGELRMVGAHIKGQLQFSSAELACSTDDAALNGDGLTVDQDMFCDETFIANGKVSLAGANIQKLDCTGGRFINPDALALDLEAITAGELIIRPDTLSGGLNLTDARVRIYRDDRATWPARLQLSGFKYDFIEAADPIDGAAPVRVIDRLHWLSLGESRYRPQVYDQLASAFRSAGFDSDAERVAIAKQKKRRTQLNPGARLWSWILEWTVGYGYRTWQAGIWLLGLLVIGAIVFEVQYSRELSPIHAAPGQPDFQPVLYTLDLLLPVVNLHQRDAWIAHGATQWLVLAFSLVGWVLTTAIVLSLSGILKRAD